MVGVKGFWHITEIGNTDSVDSRDNAPLLPLWLQDCKGIGLREEFMHNPSKDGRDLVFFD